MNSFTTSSFDVTPALATHITWPTPGELGNHLAKWRHFGAVEEYTTNAPEKLGSNGTTITPRNVDVPIHTSSQVVFAVNNLFRGFLPHILLHKPLCTYVCSAYCELHFTTSHN